MKFSPSDISKITFCLQMRALPSQNLNVDEVFPLLVILFVRDVEERHADQDGNQRSHEDTQIVNFFINVVIRATCFELEWKVVGWSCAHID